MSIKSAAANFLLPKNYLLTRLFYSTAYKLRNRGKIPLLVYQMGKVGSSTIAATLEGLPLNVPVFQIHSLTQASLEADERFYFGSTSSGPDHGWLRPSGWPNTVHLFTSYYLQGELAHLKSGRKWKVITLMREPVARNVSGFFESIEYRIPRFYERLAQGELSLTELTNVFVERYDNHDVPLRWFDEEMKTTLDIDVFAQPFRHAQGYDILESAKADVLLIRLESLQHCYQEAFQRFLGLEEVSLVTANDARDKAYYPTYQHFVQAATLPQSYLDRMYEAKVTRHFYTPAEIESFRAKWTRRNA
ncbi:MAG: putative capsular polysaccharide synthesis family protein [Caldilineaceae bacterium]